MDFSEMSDALFGALIGGGAALAGSVLTNIVVAWNLKRQHTHDAKQKVEDRKAAIRREVYPKIVDDIHALHKHFGELQHLPFGDGEGEQFQQMLQSTGKLWVIAEYETTVLSRQYVNILSESYVQILTHSVPVRRAVAHIVELKRELEIAQEKMRVAQQNMNRAEVEYAAGVDVNSLTTDLVRAEDHEFNVRKEHEAAFQETAPKRMDFMRLVFSEMEKSADTFVRLICALRKEIGLESDEAQFMTLMKEQQKRADISFDKMFKELFS